MTQTLSSLHNQKPLVICQVVLSSSFAGAERLAFDMAISLAESGHHVHFIINKRLNLPTYQPHSSLVVHRLSMLSRHDPFARERLKSVLKNITPNIIHVHLRRALTMVSAVVAQVVAQIDTKIEIPIVCSVHNSGKLKRYDKLAWLFAPTPYLYKQFSQHPHFCNKTSLLPNFSRMPAVDNVVALHTPLRFFSYGRMVEKKGFEFLINAWHQLNKEQKTSQLNELPKLTIAGDGPLKSQLQKLIDENGLGASIQLVPWIENVQQFIDGFDVFILPSLDEPFGLVLLETMARGKLVLASNCDGPCNIFGEDAPNIFKKGDTQAIVDAVNLLKTSNRLLTDQCKENVLYFRENYAHDVMLPQLLQKYYDVCNDVVPLQGTNKLASTYSVTNHNRSNSRSIQNIEEQNGNQIMPKPSITQSKITIVSCANQKFATGLTMSLVSALAQSSGHYFYELVVLDGGLEEDAKNELQQALARTSRRVGTPYSIHYIKPSQQAIDKLPHRAGTWMTYARFLLADLMPQKAVIYLDSDILCLRGIEEFYTNWDRRAAVVAARDPKQTIDKDWPDSTRPAPKNTLYFNAGLILLNLEWMREHLNLMKVDQLVKRFGMEKLKFHDQTILNYATVGQVIEVARENNWVLATEYASQVTGKWHEINMHYVGRIKPWLRADTEARRHIAEVLYFHASRAYGIDGVEQRVVNQKDFKKVRFKSHFYRFVKPKRAVQYADVVSSIDGLSDFESQLTDDCFFRF